MNNIENCADCGKMFGFTERIFSNTNGLWICEDCAIKKMQENDNKDQRIAELETKLKESEKHHKWVIEFLEKYKIKPDPAPEYSENPIIEYCKQVDDFRWCDKEENKQLKQQLAEKEKELDKYAELFGMKDKDFYVVEKTEYDKMKQGAKDIMREFTIEKLKQVKDNYQAFDGIELVGYIDQLIAEIKGGKVV